MIVYQPTVNLRQFLTGLEERKYQIGRYLHDDLIQKLYSVTFFLGKYRGLNPDLDEVIQLIEVEIKEVKRLTNQIISFSLRDLGLKEGIHELLMNYPKLNLNFSFITQNMSQDTFRPEFLGIYRCLELFLDHMQDIDWIQCIGLSIRVETNETILHLSVITTPARSTNLVQPIHKTLERMTPIFSAYGGKPVFPDSEETEVVNGKVVFPFQSIDFVKPLPRH